MLSEADSLFVYILRQAQYDKKGICLMSILNKNSI